MGLQTEHVYTCRGRQRAVFLRPGCAQVRFAVELLAGDAGQVELSFDPVEVVRRVGAIGCRLKVALLGV